ncbi:docking protein 2-like [Haliotis rubra]|uniref:docking protein 2-like n=1 Tax=Haliotis rubra TaxID=36100 RepID=UPI001EE52194|nr:docking protein 2-like [Haliotis rubra]
MCRMFRVDLSGDEEASRRCQLKGEYSLWVKDSSFCLCDITSDHVLYEWPYSYIRRFGKKRQAFYFEAGRRCSSGEGVFTMKTNQHIQIFQAAKEKTTWKSPKEHAVLPKTTLDGCREIPAYENLLKEDVEQKAVGADDSDHTYVNLNSLKEQYFARRHVDKVVGAYSEPDTTGTYLTAIPDKQEYRRAMSKDAISSTSDIEHVYSVPYST